MVKIPINAIDFEQVLNKVVCYERSLLVGLIFVACYDM